MTGIFAPLNEPRGQKKCPGLSERLRVISARIVIIIFIAHLSLSGYASTWTWTGGGGANGNWNDSANWGFAGTPGNGDTLVFQGTTGLNSTNNITNLTLNQIQFASSGFNIYGDAFTLTNSILATNTSGTNIIYASIVLAANNVQMVVSNTADLVMDGQLSGTTGVIKAGTGSLIYQYSLGDNTYSGTTLVSAGTLFLNVGGAVSISGPLVIGDGTGTGSPTVQDLQTLELANVGPITINSGGTLNLNNFSEGADFNPNLTLNGGTIETGTGTLTLAANTTITTTNDSISFIEGNLNLGSGTLTIQGSGFLLYFYATVTGSANIAQNDSINTFWGGPNTYLGNFTANGSGYVWIQNSLALGNPTNTMTLNGQSWVAIDGNINVTNQSLTINSTSSGLAVFVYGTSTNSWQADFTLDSSCEIDVATNCLFNLQGPISGPGGFTEVNPGTLLLSGSIANTYAGLTTVSGGTLVLSNSADEGAIPGNLDIYGTVRLAQDNQTSDGASINVGSGGLFDFSTFYTYFDTLQGYGTVNFGVGGWVELGLINGNSEFDGSFTGVGYAPGWTVGKVGTGTFTIGGNSTYTAGITHLLQGKTIINGSQPLIPVTVDLGATLGGSGTVGNITANGTLSPGNSLGILNSSNVTFSSSGELNVELAGPGPGTGYSQLNVTGANTLANATLVLTPAFTTPVAIGQQFDILDNEGSEPVTGIFNGLPEGAALSTGGYNFNIFYLGGTGNDVVLTLTGTPGTVEPGNITSGNGNHAIDPDECNDLDLAITNNTALPMNNISATLSTTTEGVLITQPYSDYAGVAGNASGTNATPFVISTLPDFACGSDINLQLIVNSSLGSYITSFVLQTGEPAATPLRYDVTVPIAIPDVGAVDSTNVVSGFAGFPLENVVVSLCLTGSLDSDLTNISLIAPDGTTVLLSAANGGSGYGYGTALTPDSDRTTFDDTATTPITGGAAPFVGTFRPQSPLAAFVGNATPDGNWHLHIANGPGGSPGTLLGWSLFLYPVACAGGGGSCDVCMPVISDAISTGSNVQTNRGYRDGIVSSCASPKPWSGFGDTGTNFHYNAYTFTNTSGADACVTVELQSTNDVMAATYLYNYNAANIGNNFAGSAGLSTAESAGGITTYSTEIPDGASFVVVVNEVAQAAGIQPYALTLSGLPCPPPALNIQPVKPNRAHLYWPTWAGGYTLQAAPSPANNTAWAGVTNEPIVDASQFNVTNTINSTNQFYRLLKP
jgi:autotransporter-associated beta strand protein